MIPTGTCPQCGAPFLPDAPACTQCGAAFVTSAGGTPLPPGTPPPPGAFPPPAMSPPPPSGPPPAIGRPRNTGVLVVSALLAVIALVGIGLTITSGDDDSTGVGPGTSLTGDTVDDPSTMGPGEVLLEPVNMPTTHPFTDNGRLGTETQPTVTLPDLSLPTTSVTLAPGQVPLPQVSGATPGLYGGTRNEQVCDKEQMITYLESHADKGAAWAGVQGIAVSDLRAYIGTLTPMILTHDTRVMNHGFKNGQAYAHPSVLQAGSAVLVDEYGVPRAKCSCGNPLTPPEPLTQTPTYVGPQWPTFTPTTIIVVVPTTIVVGGFTIVDLGTGELIVRPVGANPDTPDMATGDVRVTLSWNDSADLDLAVIDPNGESVNFDVRSSSSGGQLDVDANSGCSEALTEPAENIIWPDNAPAGIYTVEISLYSDCVSPGEHPFVLQVFIAGVPAQLQVGGDDGTLTPSDGIGSLSAGFTTMVFVFSRG